MCLLGDESLIPFGSTKEMSGLVVNGCIVAARIVLRNWKSPHRPQTDDWVRCMTQSASFESLIAKVNNDHVKTNQVWSHFL